MFKEIPAAEPAPEPAQLQHLRLRKADLEAKLERSGFDAQSKARTQAFIQQINQEIARIEKELAEEKAATDHAAAEATAPSATEVGK